jgi:hypothetical protein
MDSEIVHVSNSIDSLNGFRNVNEWLANRIIIGIESSKIEDVFYRNKFDIICNAIADFLNCAPAYTCGGSIFTEELDLVEIVTNLSSAQVLITEKLNNIRPNKFISSEISIESTFSYLASFLRPSYESSISIESPNYYLQKSFSEDINSNNFHTIEPISKKRRIDLDSSSTFYPEFINQIKFYITKFLCPKSLVTNSAHDVNIWPYSFRIYSKSSYIPSQKCTNAFPHTIEDNSKYEFMGYVVICLPSTHTGGEYIVKDKITECTYGFDAVQMKSPTLIQWFAFRDDCEIEMLPIISGYQVILIYVIGIDKSINYVQSSIEFRNKSEQNMINSPKENLSDSLFVKGGFHISSMLKLQKELVKTIEKMLKKFNNTIGIFLSSQDIGTNQGTQYELREQDKMIFDAFSNQEQIVSIITVAVTQGHEGTVVLLGPSKRVEEVSSKHLLSMIDTEKFYQTIPFLSLKHQNNDGNDIITEFAIVQEHPSNSIRYEQIKLALLIGPIQFE